MSSIERIESAVCDYLGTCPQYRTLRFLSPDDWNDKFGRDSSLFGGTAAIHTDDGDIFIREGYSSDAVHELVHAAGMHEDGQNQTEFILEGITQAATKEIALTINVGVRLTYQEEVDYVLKYLVPSTGLTVRELASGYAKAEKKIKFIADAIWSRNASHFDTDEWSSNKMLRHELELSLKRQVGAHNTYLNFLVDEVGLK